MQSKGKGPVNGNSDSEVVLRGDPFNCIEGCQRASSKLLVKKAISHLLAVQASLGRRLTLRYLHYDFLHGCFSDFIGVAAEE